MNLTIISKKWVKKSVKKRYHKIKQKIFIIALNWLIKVKDKQKDSVELKS